MIIIQYMNKYIIHKEHSRNKLGGHVLHKTQLSHDMGKLLTVQRCSVSLIMLSFWTYTSCLPFSNDTKRTLYNENI